MFPLPFILQRFCTDSEVEQRYDVLAYPAVSRAQQAIMMFHPVYGVKLIIKNKLIRKM